MAKPTRIDPEIKGNKMLATETLEQIERRALEITAYIESRDGAFKAEIVPEVDPLWHAITTAPGMELQVVRYLADRGFGVYLPRFETTSVVRGRLRTRRQALFPRHLFLFVWDILRHWRRVKACPGVSAILCVDERPVIVPFAAIDRMQMIEFKGPDESLAHAAILAPSRKRARRRNKKGQRPLEPIGEGSETVTISCRSYWENITTLDDEGRVDALHRALGLA